MQEIVARLPDSLLAYLALGRFANQLGDAVQAERSLREAVRRKPDAFEAHFELGLALQLQNRTQFAAESYRQTLVLKPDYAPSPYQPRPFLLAPRDRAAAP